MILLNWLMGHLKAESMPGALFLQNGNKSKVYRIEPMIEFSHKDCVFHNKWLFRKGIKVIF